MKVILQSDVPNLGKVGEIVNVRDGYARNFLVPRGLAVIADDGNVKRLGHQKRVAAKKAEKELAAAKELAERLGSTAVSIRHQAGEEGKLFGSVTNRDIADALIAEGFELDRRWIQLEEPIKSLGVFNVPVKLPRDVQASVKVYVIQQ